MADDVKLEGRPRDTSAHLSLVVSRGPAAGVEEDADPIPSRQARFIPGPHRGGKISILPAPIGTPTALRRQPSMKFRRFAGSISDPKSFKPPRSMEGLPVDVCPQ